MSRANYRDVEVPPEYPPNPTSHRTRSDEKKMTGIIKSFNPTLAIHLTHRRAGLSILAACNVLKCRSVGDRVPWEDIGMRELEEVREIGYLRGDGG
jgi:hypothetical protein